MAERKHPPSVVLAPEAAATLDAIWIWNADHFGSAHADRYTRSLRDRIDALGEHYNLGRVVEKRPYLRYIEVKRRRSGHGHVVVYSLTDDAVQVVHIFHTAQNWRVKL